MISKVTQGYQTVGLAARDGLHSHGQGDLTTPIKIHREPYLKHVRSKYTSPDQWLA